jgi:hypothetical protein
VKTATLPPCASRWQLKLQTTPPTSHTFIRIWQHICPQIQGSLYKGHTTRTKRVAAKSIAAIPAESIPFIGVAVLIADTGYELYAACETVRDLDELYAELGVAEEVPDDAIHSVCDPELPDAGEVWDGVVEKSGEWLDQARKSLD